MHKFCFSLVIFLILFVSCSTTISTYVERPAELDLGGAKKVAVIPFEVSTYGQHIGDFSRWREARSLHELILSAFEEKTDSSKNLKNIANMLTNDFAKLLMNSKEFELVSKDNVINAIKHEVKIPSDICLTGEIIDYKVEMVSKDSNRTITSKEGTSEIEYYKEYAKKIKMIIRYEFISTESGYPVYSENYPIEASSYFYERKREIPGDFSIVESELYKFENSVLRKILPHTELIKFDLLKSKDAEMKAAEKLAENNELNLSLERYSDIYERTESFEAGYNAAEIMLVKGNLQEARKLASKLLLTDDSRAKMLMNRINSEIYYQEKLECQKKAREEKLREENFIDAK